MLTPEELKYHKDHVWVKVEGKKATMGITDFAQESLGDIVYIELPEDASAVGKDAEMAEVESTKATSPILAPVSGRVIKVNKALEDSPELINEEPYGKGWIAVIEMSDPSELDQLMDSHAYEEFVEEEAEE